MPRRFNGKRRFRRFRRRGSRRLFRVNRRANNAFARGVKRVLFRTSETKVAAYDFGGAANTALVLTTNGLNVFGIPDIPQGTTNGTRIGTNLFGRWVHTSFTIKHTSANADTVADWAIYFVWPRKFSTGDAAANIVTASFPVWGMPDPNDWIYMRIKRFTTSNEDSIGGWYPGTRTNVKINWWFKMMRKFEYTGNAAVSPMKSFYLVFVNRISSGIALNAQLTLVGHLKFSFRDI